MQPRAAREPHRRKGSESIQSRELPVPEKEPVHCQPVCPCDDLQVRIAIEPMSSTPSVVIDRAMRWTIGWRPSGKSLVSNATRKRSGRVVLLE